MSDADTLCEMDGDTVNVGDIEAETSDVLLLTDSDFETDVSDVRVALIERVGCEREIVTETESEDVSEMDVDAVALRDSDGSVVLLRCDFETVRDTDWVRLRLRVPTVTSALFDLVLVADVSDDGDLLMVMEPNVLDFTLETLLEYEAMEEVDLVGDGPVLDSDIVVVAVRDPDSDFDIDSR